MAKIGQNGKKWLQEISKNRPKWPKSAKMAKNGFKSDP
jgi:hypothetical protein